MEAQLTSIINVVASEKLIQRAWSQESFEDFEEQLTDSILSETARPTYWSMIAKQDPQHIRRRTWLVIWLQILQELVGIGVVTVYAPEVFQLVSHF